MINGLSSMNLSHGKGFLMNLRSRNGISRTSSANHNFKAFSVVSFDDWVSKQTLEPPEHFFQSINYALHDAVFSGVKLSFEPSTARTQNKY